MKLIPGVQASYNYHWIKNYTLNRRSHKQKENKQKCISFFLFLVTNLKHFFCRLFPNFIYLNIIEKALKHEEEKEETKILLCTWDLLRWHCSRSEADWTAVADSEPRLKPWRHLMKHLQCRTFDLIDNRKHRFSTEIIDFLKLHIFTTLNLFLFLLMSWYRKKIN